MDNHRTVVSTIQKSPYYVELDEGNMHFERYTDKYTKEKDNTRLASFYSYDILSKYIPTGTLIYNTYNVELLGEKSQKPVHAMRLNINKISRANVNGDKEQGEDNEDNQK